MLRYMTDRARTGYTIDDLPLGVLCTKPMTWFHCLSYGQPVSVNYV